MTKRNSAILKLMYNGHYMYSREHDDNTLMNLIDTNDGYYIFNAKRDISDALYQLKKRGFIEQYSRGIYHLTSRGENYCVDMFDEDPFEPEDESEEQPIYDDDEDSDEDMNQQNDSTFNNSIWTEIANHYANIAQHYAEIAKLHTNM